MNQILIALSGKMSSGKDTFADIAVSEFGFKKISLASTLKEEVSNFLNKFGIIYKYENLYGTQADKEEEIKFPPYFDFSNMVEEYPFLERMCRGLTFRLLLQLWGTEYRRAQDDDYWVKSYNNKTRDIPLLICPDLRFKNEFNYFKSIGGLCIRINRDNGFKSNTSDHLSETDLDNRRDWYYLIENNSTLEEFERTIRSALNLICRYKG